MTGIDWVKLEISHSFSSRTLAETLLGGQAFRWYCTDVDSYVGIIEAHLFELKLASNNELFYRSATGASADQVIHYLGVVGLDKKIDALPWRSDPILAGLHQKWKSISLLNQPHGETLLAFLLSSNKQILQIRQMLNQLADRFGRPLPMGFKSLPLWSEIAELTEVELRKCALGYRARYVFETAQRLREEPDFLAEIQSLEYDNARKNLMLLPGVGAKVADCVLLFGFGFWEAFPVDTWIEKVLTQKYDLKGWSRPQLSQFARIHFGAAAGLAQQWFFSDAREERADSLYQKARIATAPSNR